MSDTSSISGMSGISNISNRTFVSEESSLVLEVLEPDRHHYYLVPLQVTIVSCLDSILNLLFPDCQEGEVQEEGNQVAHLHGPHLRCPAHQAVSDDMM